MERKIMLTTTIVLAVMILSTVSVVLANGILFYYPEMEVRGNGVVWKIDTSNIAKYVPPGPDPVSFDGRDVDTSTIQTWYKYLDEDGNAQFDEVTPKLVILQAKQILLIFKHKELPPYPVEETYVDGYLTDGAYFKATGGGFAWGRTRR